MSQYVNAAERGFSQSILSSESQSEFELKAYLVKNRLHIEESQKAIESIKDKWSENSVEDIKKEIERQSQLGLQSYVIQWGRYDWKHRSIASHTNDN